MNAKQVFDVCNKAKADLTAVCTELTSVPLTSLHGTDVLVDVLREHLYNAGQALVLAAEYTENGEETKAAKLARLRVKVKAMKQELRQSGMDDASIEAFCK